MFENPLGVGINNYKNYRKVTDNTLDIDWNTKYGTIKFKEKYIVYLHLMRFFFSHAFIDATNKWNERCAYITKESLKNTRINNKTRFFIYLTLLAFYPYRALYSFRLFIGKLFRLLRLK